MTQGRWQEKKNHACQKKVQGEGTCSAYTFHPNLNHTCPHGSHCQPPNTSSNVHCRVHTSDGIQIGKFAEVTCPTTRPQNKGPILPPLEDIPNAPVSQSTPWPSTGSASENLFETRKDWPISPTPTPTSAPTVKTEAPPQVAVIPHAMVMPSKLQRNAHWDHIDPFARMRKNMKKIGTVKDRQKNQGCAHKMHSTPRY